MTVARLLLLLALASGQAAAEESLLDSLTWSKRVLLVFAPDAGTPDLNRQRELLAEEPGMLERDLVVIEILNDTVRVAGSAAAADPSALRQRFGVDADTFTVVLVGKDGSAKRRSSTPLDACDLFATIDAMPMRRSEMARAGQQAANCTEGPSGR